MHLCIFVWHLCITSFCITSLYSISLYCIFVIHLCIPYLCIESLHYIFVFHIFVLHICMTSLYCIFVIHFCIFVLHLCIAVLLPRWRVGHGGNVSKRGGLPLPSSSPRDQRGPPSPPSRPIHGRPPICVLRGREIHRGCVLSGPSGPSPRLARVDRVVWGQWGVRGPWRRGGGGEGREGCANGCDSRVACKLRKKLKFDNLKLLRGIMISTESLCEWRTRVFLLYTVRVSIAITSCW